MGPVLPHGAPMAAPERDKYDAAPNQMPRQIQPPCPSCPQLHRRRPAGLAFEENIAYRCQGRSLILSQVQPALPSGIPADERRANTLASAETAAKHSIGLIKNSRAAEHPNQQRARSPPQQAASKRAEGIG